MFLMHCGCDPAGWWGELEGPRSVSALSPRHAAQLVSGGRGPSAPVYGGSWDLCFWGPADRCALHKPCGLWLGCTSPLAWGGIRFPCSTPGPASGPSSTSLCCCCSGSPRAAEANYDSKPSCLYKEAYFSMQKYKPMLIFMNILESLLLKM